jgi:G3E family GTPase
VPILSTVMMEPVLRHHFRLGSVVTTVDAVNGPLQAAAVSRAVFARELASERNR